METTTAAAARTTSKTALATCSSSTADSTAMSGPLGGERSLQEVEGPVTVGEPIQRGSGILEAVKFLSAPHRSSQQLHKLSQGACAAMMEAYNASVVSDERNSKFDVEQALNELLDKYTELTKETVEEYRNERDRERGVGHSSESLMGKRSAKVGGDDEGVRKRRRMRSDDESSSATMSSTTAEVHRREGTRRAIALLDVAQEEDGDHKEDDDDEGRKSHHNKGNSKTSVKGKVKKKRPISFKITDAEQVTRKFVKAMKAECLTVTDRQKALRGIFMGSSPELREAAIANFTHHKGLELIGSWMKEVNKDKDPEVGPMLVYLGCLERVVMTVDLLRATSIGKMVTASVKAFSGRSEMVVTNGRRLIEKWKKIACSSGVSPGGTKPQSITSPPPPPATPPGGFKPVIAAKSSAPYVPVVAAKSSAPPPLSKSPTTNDSSVPATAAATEAPSPPPSRSVGSPQAAASKSPALTLPVGRRRPAGMDSLEVRGSPMNSPHFSPPPAVQSGSGKSPSVPCKDSDTDRSKVYSEGRRSSTDDLEGLMDLMSPGGRDDDDAREVSMKNVPAEDEEETSFGAVPTNIEEDDDMADILGLMDLPGTTPGEFDDDDHPAGLNGDRAGASAEDEGNGQSRKPRLQWKKDEELVNMVVFIKNEPLWDTVQAINDARGTHVTYVEHGHTSKFMEQRKKEDAMGGTQLRHQYGHLDSAPAATGASPSRGKRSTAAALLASLGGSSSSLEDSNTATSDNIGEKVIWLKQLPMVILPTDCTRVIGQLKSYERQDLADLHGGRTEVFYSPEAGVRIPDSPAEPAPGRSVFLMAPDALQNETVEVKLKVKDSKSRKKAASAVAVPPRADEDTGVVVLDEGLEGSPGAPQQPSLTEVSPVSSDDSVPGVQDQEDQILAALITASTGGPIGDGKGPLGSAAGEVRFESEFVKLDPGLQEAIIKSEQFLKLFQDQPWLMINLTTDSLGRIGKMMDLYREKAKEEAEEEAQKKKREAQAQAQQAQMAAEMQAKLGHSPSPTPDDISSSAAESSPSRTAESYEKRGWGVTSILTSLKEQVRTHVRSEVAAAATHSTPSGGGKGWLGSYGRGGGWYPSVPGGGSSTSSTGYGEGWDDTSGGQGWASSTRKQDGDGSYHLPSEHSVSSSSGTTGYADASRRYGGGAESYKDRYTMGGGKGGGRHGGYGGGQHQEEYGKGGGKGGYHGKGSGGYKGGGGYGWGGASGGYRGNSGGWNNKRQQHWPSPPPSSTTDGAPSRPNKHPRTTAYSSSWK